jgi:hypothetical protein
MKKKISKSSFHKKTRAIVTHKGFIAVSMFALGSLLPFAFPTPTPPHIDMPTNERSFDFMKHISPFPSGMQGCHTETTDNGTTTICNQQAIVTGTNNQITNNDFKGTGTIPFPSLPAFCHYDGTRIICKSPLPTNLPLPSGMTMPVIPSITVPLPSLPANCQYKTTGASVAITCTQPSGMPTEPSITTMPPTDITVTITPMQQQSANTKPNTKKNMTFGSLVNFFKSLFHF